MWILALRRGWIRAVMLTEVQYAGSVRWACHDLQTRRHLLWQWLEGLLFFEGYPLGPLRSGTTGQVFEDLDSKL